jgi:biotin operon repressor
VINPYNAGESTVTSKSGLRHRAALSTVAVLLAGLAACTTTPSQTTSNATPPPQDHQQQPVATKDGDWAGVSQALGRPGKLTDTVYRVPLVRSDLMVSSQGVAVKPGLSLGGYATFTRYADTGLLMGDLVVTETEVPKVINALQAHGIELTALHKHLLEQSPPVWWIHVHAMGDPVQLAQGLKAALDATALPAPTPAPAVQPPVAVDTAGIDAALGRKGTADGGIYKFTVARNQAITVSDHVLPAGLGLTTSINFQPVGADKAAINGDFALTGEEINPVIAALRRGGIQIVEVHNHSLDEQPRLFYLHFWAVDDAVALAKALRPALDATNVKPAS